MNPDNGSATASLPPRFNHTRWFLIAYYCFAAAEGIHNIRVAEASGFDLVLPIAFAICMGSWVIIDAERRRQPIPLLARPWFLLMAGLVVPGYVIWTRGWRGLGYVVLHATLGYVVAAIFMNVGGMIVFGAEWWDAVDW